MKSKIIPRTVFVLAILFFLGACSSSGKLEINHAKSKSIPPGKTVSLLIKSEPIARKETNPPRDDEATEEQKGEQAKREHSVRMIQRLRSELFGRLVSEAVFKHVLHPREKGDYVMEVRVLDSEEVSQGARIFLGVLAGSNKLRCAVRLVDHATGRAVTDFNVEGESAAHPLSSENGLEDAVREVVSNIIIALR